MELLVVVGILVLLIAITMAFIGRAQRQAEVTKAKAELNAISSAIEQFKTDHGFYPMAADPQPVLAEALIGPGKATDPLKMFPRRDNKVPLDGVDGPGYQVNGKKWSAYLPADAYLTELERPSVTTSVWLLLDRYDNPIVYLPKRKNIAPQGFDLVQDSGATGNALFDLRDGWDNRSPKQSDRISRELIQALLGDTGDATGGGAFDKRIGAGETYHEARFILASPGPDREFTKRLSGETGNAFLSRLRKSDDVFNIDF